MTDARRGPTPVEAPVETPTEAQAETQVSELAAGDLAPAEAARVRKRLARDPELANLYGEIRAVQRGLLDFAAAAGPPPVDLEGRILARTLPRFRALYGRRPNYWPTWAAAAAAAAAFLFFQPPLVRGALETLPRVSEGMTVLRAAANRQTDRAVAEFGVLRASVAFALEDRMDRLNDRLRDLERATRHRGEVTDGAPNGVLTGPGSVETPRGDTAP